MNQNEQEQNMNSVAVDYDRLSLDIAMQFIEPLPDHPEGFAHRLTGSIMVPRENLEEDDSGDFREQIGHIEARLIRLGDAIEAGWDLYTILDAPSHSTCECLGLFDGYEYSGAVQKLLYEEATLDRLLLVDRIEIKPEHRGHNAGLYAMRGLIDLLGEGCSVVVCKPFPLQFERVKADKKELADAQRKVRKHWSKVGFKRVPKTDLYVLSPLLRLPKLPALKD